MFLVNKSRTKCDSRCWARFQLMKTKQKQNKSFVETSVSPSAILFFCFQETEIFVKSKSYSKISKKIYHFSINFVISKL